jgi:hypothetical protein
MFRLFVVPNLVLRLVTEGQITVGRKVALHSITRKYESRESELN